MKQLLPAFGVAVTLVIAGCSSGGDAEPVTFEPPDGGYTVEFDEEPEPVEIPIPMADGSSVSTEAWMVEHSDRGNITYFLDYEELLGDDYVGGGDVDSTLIAMRDGSVSSSGGTLLENESIELDGVPGLKFGYSIDQGGESGYGVAVVYFDEPVMYYAAGVGERDTADSSEAFVDTFAFTDAATGDTASGADEEGDG